MTIDSTIEIIIIAICLLLGGILKGVTGAGAPIIAIPALTVLFDARFAIVVMLIPNLLTNSWQAWQFRKHLLPPTLTIPLAVGGVIGILIGTYALASLSTKTLSLIVAFAVLAYIALRLTKPDWQINESSAKKLALPAGIASGFLQGSAGLSAPASITFLNAMRLPRSVFIATISALFTAITVVQFPALWQAGLLSSHLMLVSAFAFVPIFIGMPLGSRLAKTISPVLFDRIILVLLALIAVRLFVKYLF